MRRFRNNCKTINHATSQNSLTLWVGVVVFSWAWKSISWIIVNISSSRGANLDQRIKICSKMSSSALLAFLTEKQIRVALFLQAFHFFSVSVRQFGMQTKGLQCLSNGGCWPTPLEGLKILYPLFFYTNSIFHIAGNCIEG